LWVFAMGCAAPLRTRAQRKFVVNVLIGTLCISVTAILFSLYWISDGEALSDFELSHHQLETLRKEREREAFLFQQFVSSTNQTLAVCETELKQLTSKLESDLLLHARIQKRFESLHLQIQEQSHPSHFLLTVREVQLWEKRKQLLLSTLQQDKALPKPFLFMHLAKTGGTAYYNILTLSKVFVLHFWSFPSEEEVYHSGFHNFPVVGGHVSHGFHKWWNGSLEDYSYFTILREPVERVISHYRYHVSRPQDPNYFRAANRTIVEWVREVKQGQNAMTAYLSGAEWGAWWNRNDPDFDLPMLPHYADPPSNFVVTEKHYLRARENLIQSIVGLQEHFEQSVQQFEEFFKLGTDVRKASTKANVGEGEVLHLNSQEIAVIHMMNHWDIGLYELAKLLFKQQKEILDLAKLK